MDAFEDLRSIKQDIAINLRGREPKEFNMIDILKH